MFLESKILLDFTVVARPDDLAQKVTSLLRARSGSLAVEDASLHVVVAATHCFDKTLVDTLVEENVNPIEKAPRLHTHSPLVPVFLTYSASYGRVCESIATVCGVIRFFCSDLSVRTRSTCDTPDIPHSLSARGLLLSFFAESLNQASRCGV